MPTRSGMATGANGGSECGARVPWRDGKRYGWLLGLVVPLLPVVAAALVASTGHELFWFSGPVMVFVIIPLLDWLIGMDPDNPPEDVVPQLEEDRYYRRCTYAFLPLQYGSLVAACWFWGRGELSLLASVGLSLTVGCVAGIGINAAHELGHKRDALERWLSKLALAQSGYGHFFVEHNRGHHVRVATPEDPASARFGESFYRFFPRTVVGSFRSSLALERERLARVGKSFWTLDNDLLSAWGMSALLFGGLLASFGLGIAPYLLIQALLGIALLEVVNYLEHYGLSRKRDPQGRYERCRPEHSWNSNSLCTNLFLYHLQRHSDHHAHPMRRFQALRSFDEAPNLPSGYATMLLLALVPPLWRRVMDPRVLRHYGGDLARANLLPSKRAQLLARSAASRAAS